MKLNRLKLVLINVLIIATLSIAQLPQGFKVNGLLRDADGNFYEDQNVVMNFSLYSQPNEESLLFTEDLDVTIRDGVYDALIGESDTLLNEIFLNECWLLTKIDGEVIGDFVKIHAVPTATISAIAQRAMVSDSVSDNLKIADNTLVRSINGIKDDMKITSSPEINIIDFKGINSIKISLDSTNMADKYLTKLNNENTQIVDGNVEFKGNITAKNFNNNSANSILISASQLQVLNTYNYNNIDQFLGIDTYYQSTVDYDTLTAFTYLNLPENAIIDSVKAFFYIKVSSNITQFESSIFLKRLDNNTGEFILYAGDVQSLTNNYKNPINDYVSIGNNLRSYTFNINSQDTGEYTWTFNWKAVSPKGLLSGINYFGFRFARIYYH